MTTLEGLRAVALVLEGLLAKATIQQDQEGMETFRDLVEDVGMLMNAHEEVSR